MYWLLVTRSGNRNKCNAAKRHRDDVRHFFPLPWLHAQTYFKAPSKASMIAFPVLYIVVDASFSASVVDTS